MTSGDPGGSLLPPPSFGRDLTHGDDARHLEVFDRYERRTYELDRLIDQLFLYGCSARNVERVSKDLWGKKVGRSTVSRVSETFEDEGKAINDAPVPGEIRAICTSTARPTRCPPSWGSLNKQLLAAFAILADGTERLLGYRLAESESESEWGMLLDDLKARGLRAVELIVVDGAGGLESALATRFSDVPVQRCIMHVARNVMAKVRARNKAEVGPTTPNPKPHLTSNRSRDEIVSAVSCTCTTPTRPEREQAWDRAMNGDREPLSDLAQNAGTRPSGRSASDGFACRRLAGFPRDRHVAFPIVSSWRLRQRVQGFLPPSPICFTPPVELVASTLADVASLRA